jgi:3-methyladenine DNA glycosylase AlkD
LRAADALQRLHSLADPHAADSLQQFFKTGPADYGAGDRFLGIRMPMLRKLVVELAALPLAETQKLLHSEYHEARLLALLILVRGYEHGTDTAKDKIFRLYLDNTRFINNWDLVDLSAAQIVGAHLQAGDRMLLDTLARSSLLWERRIAIIATFHFIRQFDFADTLRIAALLQRDPHDLIHKAVGWMLREVGKRDVAVEEAFLDRHCREMPRTMLRYAIEKFPEQRRRHYMARD